MNHKIQIQNNNCKNFFNDQIQEQKSISLWISLPLNDNNYICFSKNYRAMKQRVINKHENHITLCYETLNFFPGPFTPHKYW